MLSVPGKTTVDVVCNRRKTIIINFSAVHRRTVGVSFAGIPDSSLNKI